MRRAYLAARAAVAALAAGGAVGAAAAGLAGHYALGRRRAARFYDRAGDPRDDGVRLALGALRSLRVLPLVDWYAARADLATEAGVSHARPDHLGGVRNFLGRRATLGPAPADPLAGRPVYAPVPLAVTGGTSTIVAGPRVLAPGVGTTGAVPVGLFLGGYTLEQALVAHVAGQGLAVVVGCGHPGVEALVERAKRVFQAPVYAVVGGLHLPVTQDRAALGPVKLQQFAGRPEPP
jgi:hypothetical protein